MGQQVVNVQPVMNKKVIIETYCTAVLLYSMPLLIVLMKSISANDLKGSRSMQKCMALEQSESVHFIAIIRG